MKLVGISPLAALTPLLAGRRGGALWGQRAGVSLCEAAMRELCGRLDVPGSTRAVQTRLCVSAGRLLLGLASPLPLAPRVCERTLLGHTDGVYALAACAGGKLASGSWDKTINIWSAHGQDGAAR